MKVVLNPRQNEKEFYKTILHPTNVILTRGVEGVHAIKVDKDELEEFEVAASFVEKVGVFDKAPAAESAPHAETTPPQTSEPSISKATFDKLVADIVEVKADVAEVKANQLEIKAKFENMHKHTSNKDYQCLPLPSILVL